MKVIKCGKHNFQDRFSLVFFFRVIGYKERKLKQYLESIYIQCQLWKRKFFIERHLFICMSGWKQKKNRFIL